MSGANRPGELGLAELLVPLSLATDLANGFPLEKALRDTLLAVRLGERAGLTGRTLSDVFYVALLRSVGCTALDYEMGSSYGDAIATRSLLSALDMGRPRETLPRVLRHLGESEGPARRAAAVGRFVRGGRRERPRLQAVAAEVVVRMTDRLRLGPGVAAASAQLFERWDGRGAPTGASGEALAPVARVVHLANAAEIHYRLEGREGARRFIRRGSGGWFDPNLAALFVAEADDLLAPLKAASVRDTVLAAEPSPRRTMPDDRLGDVTAAFADFVDLQSSWTLGHSTRVSELAAAAAGAMRVSAVDVGRLRHAGRVHDLGRVSVSNSVWDKPGALHAADWERVRLHPYYSERVLGASSVLAPMGALAGLHHERLDASGYHRNVPAAMQAMPARILAAADCFAAMTEPRPYRPALTTAAAAAELAAEVAAGRLDRDVVSAVCDVAGPALRVASAWPAGLGDREVGVLRRLVRGDRQHDIATALHLEPAVVLARIADVYSRLGVSSRAAAALFAMEHRLLDP